MLPIRYHSEYPYLQFKRQKNYAYFLIPSCLNESVCDDNTWLDCMYMTMMMSACRAPQCFHVKKDMLSVLAKQNKNTHTHKWKVVLVWKSERSYKLGWSCFLSTGGAGCSSAFGAVFAKTPADTQRHNLYRMFKPFLLQKNLTKD